MNYWDPWVKHLQALFDSIKYLSNNLPEELKDHIARTCKLGEELALIHGADTGKCDLAIKAHDLFRHNTDQELLSRSSDWNITIGSVEHNDPILLHGPIAASVLKKRLKCPHQDVIDAVKYHTTGRPDMSLVEKIVFIADKVEPAKVKYNDSLVPILELSKIDLDKSIEMYLSFHITERLEGGHLVHPLAIETWNWFVVQTVNKTHGD